MSLTVVFPLNGITPRKIICLVLTILIVQLPAGSSTARPNVVFILADDFGWNDIGYHGEDQGSAIKTPILDRLAEDGVKLENYYVQHICSPTRSQLLSGRYQIHTGLQHRIIHDAQPFGLPLDEVTLPELLRDNGYATHMVGKWHLGFFKDAYMPTERGFDSFFGFLIGSEHHSAHHSSYNFNGTMRTGYDLRANKTSVVHQYDGQYSTHLYTTKAIDIIQRHDKSKPLFLYLAHAAVHAPLEVPDSYMKPYAHIADSHRRTYAGMVACMDEAVGNLIDALKDADMYNNTVIIFSTDNGGYVPYGANNWPLRGEKGTLWEGGIRGIGFVHSPLLDASLNGIVNRELMHVSDWLPTIVEGIAGGSLNGTKPLDGLNVWNAINGTSPSPRTEILHNIDPLELAHPLPRDHKVGEFSPLMMAALRVGEWKIQTGSGIPSRNSWMPPKESGLPTVHPADNPDKRVWLFNISADPLEQTDLSEEYPDVVAWMLQRLKYYYNDSVPVWYPDEDMNADPSLHGGIWGPWL